MADLGFLFSVALFELTSSISTMKMLAQQAENNVQFAMKAANEPGAILTGEFEEEVQDESGVTYLRTRTYYSCGSCVGYDEEVREEYKMLIAALTRRSAFLTMFGLFEHRISGCLDLMISLTNFGGDLEYKGPIEKTDTILKKGFNARDIDDVDHLTIIRNIMAHNDGMATKYHEIRCKEGKKTTFEKRLIKAIERTQGIEVNIFNGIIVDEQFLTYVVSEFSRYANALEHTIQKHNRPPPLHQRSAME
ncbi:hypothetical protein ACI2KS_22735 [Pseudomonas sp. NPDC087358]|uniref:hypothetical protein n=1 Tax=Pseudomonas sp. NPDC087358 TaxID=3364439 RepID=UPI0038501A43